MSVDMPSVFSVGDLHSSHVMVDTKSLTRLRPSALLCHVAPCRRQAVVPQGNERLTLMVSQCQRREDDRTTTISIPIENLFNLCCTTSSHLRRAHRTNPDTSTGGQASKPCMLSVVLAGHLAVNPDRRHTTAAKPSMVR